MSTGKLKKDLALLTRSGTQRPGSFRTIVRVVTLRAGCDPELLFPVDFGPAELPGSYSPEPEPEQFIGLSSPAAGPGPESLAARKLQPGDSRAA